MNGENLNTSAVAGASAPPVDAPAHTPPPVAPEPQSHGGQDNRKPWLILVIVIVAVLAVIFLPRGKDKDEPANNFNITSFENISGVQGMVGYIDYSGQKFVTERIVLLEENGKFQTKRDVFNFRWDENTRFLYYRNSLALEASQPWEVDQTFLTTTRNVIVTTKEKPNPDKDLMALEIKILPGSTQADSSN